MQRPYSIALLLQNRRKFVRCISFLKSEERISNKKTIYQKKHKMSLQKFMANNANYHVWATQKFVDWLSTKPDELLHQEVPSSFNSIIKTLNHIWATDEYWYSIIAETSNFENRSEVTNLISKEIFEGMAYRANEISKLVSSYNEKELSKTIKIETPWFKCNLPKYEYLQQLINHATYHRGQIVTIGRTIGITDGSNTDYNFYNIYK